VTLSADTLSPAVIVEVAEPVIVAIPVESDVVVAPVAVRLVATAFVLNEFVDVAEVVVDRVMLLKMTHQSIQKRSYYWCTRIYVTR